MHQGNKAISAASARIACAVLIASVGATAACAAAPLVLDKAGKQLQVPARKDAPKPKLVLHTTMATWCAPCKKELPHFSYLRSVFKPEELGMYGLPYDEKERPEQLRAWASTHRPPYELLSDLTRADIASVKGMVLTNLKMDAVPATIITDTDGRILRTRWGPPSVSELRELLRSQNDRR